VQTSRSEPLSRKGRRTSYGVIESERRNDDPLTARDTNADSIKDAFHASTVGRTSAASSDAVTMSAERLMNLQSTFQERASPSAKEREELIFGAY
jgi:hypothetical protein